MKKPRKTLIVMATLVLFGLLAVSSGAGDAKAATEFICTIKNTGGDYSSLNDWQTSNQCDLTSAQTKVFYHQGITGTIGDGVTVTGLTSSATGTATHVTSNQILIKNISGTFQAGEQVYRLKVVQQKFIFE